MSAWTVLSCLDIDCGNFALQASDALSPNATSYFRLGFLVVLHVDIYRQCVLQLQFHTVNMSINCVFYINSNVM